MQRLRENYGISGYDRRGRRSVVNDEAIWMVTTVHYNCQGPKMNGRTTCQVKWKVMRGPGWLPERGHPQIVPTNVKLAIQPWLPPTYRNGNFWLLSLQKKNIHTTSSNKDSFTTRNMNHTLNDPRSWPQLDNSSTRRHNGLVHGSQFITSSSLANIGEPNQVDWL